MARDIEADAVINDKSSAGLRKFEQNVRKSNDKVKKDYDSLGKNVGDGILKGIGAVAPQLASSLAGAIGDSAKLGGPVLAAGIAAGLPLLSGLIGAAVTGGAAGAGIIGGVALAVQDSRVKAAGTQLGANLLSGLSDRAGSFVQPVLQSIDLIEAKFLESGDALESIFQGASKFVVPLVDSVGTAVQSLVSGIDTAVGKAGPVMEALNRGIVTVGQSAELFMGNLSASAEGNAAALDTLFETVSGVLAVVGPLIQSLSTVYGWLDKIGLASGLLVTLDKAFNGTAEESENAAAALERQNDVMQRGGLTVEQATTVQEAYNKSLEENAAAAQDALDAQQGLFAATTSYGAALDAAKKSANDNGATLSENTKKGRENRSALDSLAGAYKRVTAEQAATGASSSAVSAKQATLRKQFYDVALSMTGSAKKARDLTNSLLGIPSPKPKVTLNTANVASQARNARQEIAQIKGKSVTVTVNVNASRLNAVYARLERIGANNAAGDSFGQVAGGQSFRTGGAAQVSATVQNTINLDGRPFRAYTQKAIATERGRERFRDKVGRRA